MNTYLEPQLYIAGEWRRGEVGPAIFNPADEKAIGHVPMARRADLDDAVMAAEDGFKIWRDWSPRARGELIQKAAALMRERIDDVAYAITLEHGKPLKQAQLEVIRGAEFYEWDAAEGQRTYGRIIPSEPGIKYAVHHQPIGPVAAFSPWNFPMSQPARKIAGALAAGCSIILKAAEETPAGAIHMARAFHDAGLPRGVLNLVFGVPAEISGYLISRPEIRLVAFTGSTAVGKQLTGLAAQHMKPVLMELGGHAPVIVCSDADPVKAGTISAARKARNCGQVCTSPTRFYVHEDAYAAFTEAFVHRAQSITIGNGLDATTEMGPLANHRRIEAMERLVADARGKGARILAGGERLERPGYFFPLTVLTDVPDDASVMREEPFGPLAVINPVSSLDEAIEKANRLPFGLAAYGFTNSALNADRLANRLEAGNVSINTLEASVAETPFGGIKESGYGREGGQEGLAPYMIIKTVSHKLTV